MTDAEVPASRPDSWPTMVMTAAAAFAVGVAFGIWSWGLVNASFLVWMSGGVAVEQSRLDALGIAVVLVVAGSVALILPRLGGRGSARSRPTLLGWLIAAAGLAVLLGFEPFAPRPVLLVAAVLGAVLGGVLFALSRSSGPAKLVGTVGLGTGVFAALPVEQAVTIAGFHPRGIVAAGLGAALLVAAVTARQPAAAEPGNGRAVDLPVGVSARAWAPVAVVGIVGLASWLASAGRQSVVDSLLRPGGSRRVAFVESADRFAIIGIAVAVAIAGVVRLPAGWEGVGPVGGRGIRASRAVDGASARVVGVVLSERRGGQLRRIGGDRHIGGGRWRAARPVGRRADPVGRAGSAGISGVGHPGGGSRRAFHVDGVVVVAHIGGCRVIPNQRVPAAHPERDGSGCGRARGTVRDGSGGRAIPAGHPR